MNQPRNGNNYPKNAPCSWSKFNGKPFTKASISSIKQQATSKRQAQSNNNNEIGPWTMARNSETRIWFTHPFSPVDAPWRLKQIRLDQSRSFLGSCLSLFHDSKMSFSMISRKPIGDSKPWSICQWGEKSGAMSMRVPGTNLKEIRLNNGARNRYRLPKTGFSDVWESQYRICCAEIHP